jgi:PAS domain S-box-containing protein
MASRAGTSEQRYRLIVDSALDYAIFTMDAAGIIDSWPPGAEAVFGWSPTEAIGQPVSMLFTPEDRALHEDVKELEIARLTGVAPDVRWHVCKDGHRVFIEGTTRSLPDDERGVRGFLKIGQDVTDRRALVDALLASENRFRAVANVVPDLLWEANGEGVPTWYNDRWYAYAGLPEGEVATADWQALIHPEDRETSRASFDSALKAGQAFRIEHRMRRADGAYNWFLVRGEPARDDDGKVVRWFGAATDVNEQRSLLDAAERAHAEADAARREVEQRVLERTAELAKANESLESSIREVERANRERNALRRQLDVASEEERRRLSRELHDEVGQHLTALGLGLQTLSDIVPAGSEAYRRATGLRELAETLGRELHAVAVRLRPQSLDDFGLESALCSYVEDWSRHSDIAIDTHLHLGPTRLTHEVESAIYRIIQEALTNVAKHSRAARASLVVERLDGVVRVIIEDDGRGFDTAAIGGVEVSSRRLGLRGMQERAVLLGGSLEVESSPGSGTTLFVRMPVDASRTSGETDQVSAVDT